MLERERSELLAQLVARKEKVMGTGERGDSHPELECANVCIFVC